MAPPILTPDVVRAVINASPGKKISHADLIAQLRASDYRGIGMDLMRMSQRGEITATTERQENSKPILFYTLPA